jgi:hypothetical protein
MKPKANRLPLLVDAKTDNKRTITKPAKHDFHVFGIKTSQISIDFHHAELDRGRI